MLAKCTRCGTASITQIHNFAEYDEGRITVNDDICATAKGYERMLEMKLIKNGGAL